MSGIQDHLQQRGLSVFSEDDSVSAADPDTSALCREQGEEGTAASALLTDCSLVHMQGRRTVPTF